MARDARFALGPKKKVLCTFADIPSFHAVSTRHARDL
jgi:hypothetical protein